MKPIASLSATFLAGLASAATPGYYDFSQDVGLSAMNMMSLYLDNTAEFNQVMDHGCHCARFDPTSKKSILGGNSYLDEVDRICRDWFQARMCLDKYERGTCYEQEADNYAYQIALLVDSNTGNPNNAICNTHNSELSLPYNDCEIDSCLVDAHYVKQIEEFLNSNPGFAARVAVEGDCPTEQAIATDRYCAGQAPDVKITAGLPPTTTELTTTTDIPIIKEYGSTATGHLVFIIDRSSENSASDYLDSISFVRGVVAPLIIGPNNTVVSIIGMSDTVHLYGEAMDSMTLLNSTFDFIETDQALVADRDMAAAMDLANGLLGFRSLAGPGIGEEFRPRAGGVRVSGPNDRSLFGLMAHMMVMMITGGPTSTSNILDNGADPFADGHQAGITAAVVSYGNAIADAVQDSIAATVATDPVMAFVIGSIVETIVQQIVQEVTEIVTQIYVQVANDLPPTMTPPTTTLSTSTLATSTEAISIASAASSPQTSTASPGQPTSTTERHTFTTTTGESSTSESTESTSTSTSQGTSTMAEDRLETNSTPEVTDFSTDPTTTKTDGTSQTESVVFTTTESTAQVSS